MENYIRNMAFSRGVKGGTAFALCAAGCAHSLGMPAGSIGQAPRLRRPAKTAYAKRPR